jgi:hypothetical protein
VGEGGRGRGGGAAVVHVRTVRERQVHQKACLGRGPAGICSGWRPKAPSGSLPWIACGPSCTWRVMGRGEEKRTWANGGEWVPDASPNEMGVMVSRSMGRLEKREWLADTGG